MSIYFLALPSLCYIHGSKLSEIYAKLKYFVICPEENISDLYLYPYSFAYIFVKKRLRYLCIRKRDPMSYHNFMRLSNSLNCVETVFTPYC